MDDLLKYPWLMFIISIVSYPLYKTYAQICFGDKFEKLSLVFHYLWQRDSCSASKGEYWSDWSYSMRFYIFMGICILWNLAVYEGFCRLFFE